VYQFAERLHGTGRGAWVYRFDWTAPGNRFGACHCIELPFMFDTLTHWQAPMLEGADANEKSTVAATVRNTWAAFARHGDPNHTDLPHWPRHAAKGETLLINHPSSVHNDPAGRQRWKYWP
jgi:para-nitrobenzyl esterase